MMVSCRYPVLANLSDVASSREGGIAHVEDPAEHLYPLLCLLEAVYVTI